MKSLICADHNPNTSLYYPIIKDNNLTKFKEYLEIYPLEDIAIQKLYNYSCTSGSLEIMKFLLTDSDFSHISFGIYGFINAAHLKHWKLVKYFIFEYHPIKDISVEKMIMNLNQDIQEKLSRK